MEPECACTACETERGKLRQLICTFGKDRVSWIDPAGASEAEARGWLSSYEMAYRSPRYEGTRAYVNLGSVAAGDDHYSQSTTTWQRSNYRTLVIEYPDAFVPLSYMNRNDLGAFVDRLTLDLVETLCSLQEQYPVYDESDLSDLESEEITESWDRYLSSDLYSDLDEWAQDLWFAFTPDEVREIFWAVIDKADYYPEHNGLDVLWDTERISELLTDALCTAYLAAVMPAECDGQTVLECAA